MLLIAVIIAAVLILPVALRFAEGGPPDNSVVHTSDDSPVSSDGERPDDLLAAA